MDIKQNILDFLKDHPYSTEKDIKDGVEGSEQNIATQIRQLLDEGKVHRQKSNGIFRWFIVTGGSEAKQIETPTEEPVVEIQLDGVAGAVVEVLKSLPTNEVPKKLKTIFDALEKGTIINKNGDVYSINESLLNIQEESFPGDNKVFNLIADDIFEDLREIKKVDRTSFNKLKDMLRDASTLDDLYEIKKQIDKLGNNTEAVEPVVPSTEPKIEIQPSKGSFEDIKTQIKQGYDTQIKLIQDKFLSTQYSPSTILTSLGKLMRAGEVQKVDGKLIVTAIE